MAARFPRVKQPKHPNHTCVCANVFLQITGGLEGLVTALLGAGVGFLPRVYPGVTLQPVACGKSLAARRVVALERAITRV